MKGTDVNRNGEKDSAPKSRGVRLGQLNVLLICVGFVISALMIYSTYQTTGTVNDIVAVTGDYLNNQQTGGMLSDMSEDMTERATAFVRDGDPGAAHAYAGRMNAMNAQLAAYAPEDSDSIAANEPLLEAVALYRTKCETEARAMRLAADTLPGPAFEALPDFLKNTELGEPDRSLIPEEKKEAALALLSSEEYTGYDSTITSLVNESHRTASEQGQIQAEETSTNVRKIVSAQKILVFLMILLAVLALVLNRMLIISPLRKSVNNLDQHEPIPEEGSYEMRHLATVYNEVLKDNELKTEALSYTATHDALTGVFNRAAFDKAYKEFEGKQTGIIVVDVDHFKQYNDEYGHDIGDRVLCIVADALKRYFREEDHISRIGGDEFCVILPDMHHNHTWAVKEKIRKINRELSQISDELPSITISAGIACWDRPDPQGSLFKDADTALLGVKKTRKDCCAVYGEA